MTQLRRRTGTIHQVVRSIAAALFVAGAVFAYRKYRVTDEQAELTRYVNTQVPALLDRERAVHARLDRLSATPGPTPAEARALLVDDVIPRLVALRSQAAAVDARTARLRAITAEYLAAIDGLIDACRTSVRTIDDPGVSTEDGAKRVRAKFLEAGAGSRAWAAHLRDACVAAGLAPPPD